MKIYKNCPAVLGGYLRYLDVVKLCSPNTIDARFRDVKDFLQFLRSREEPDLSAQSLLAGEVWVEDMQAEKMAAVTEEDLEEYIDSLTNDRKLTYTTVYRRLGSLRLFYTYLLSQKEELGIHMDYNPVPERSGTVAPDKPSRALSPSEVSRLLKAIQGETAVRDVAIVLLMVTTGISTHELVKIRYEDYREDTLVVAGRVVHLTESCQKAIEDYLYEFRDPISQFLKDKTLFVSNNYLRRLTSRGLQKNLQKHFDRAGIEGTARDLRQTAIMELLQSARNECERSYIAGYLGYTNPASINRLPLPKTSESAMPQILENSWLNDLGKRD